MRDFLKGLAKFLGVTALVLFVAAGALYGLFMKVVVLGHNAMAPTIVAGDRVLLWSTQSFELGEIALCPHPSSPGRLVMGRVMGRGGHRLTMERGQLEIDGSSPDRDVRGTVAFDDTETGARVRMTWGTESLLDRDYTFFEREGREPSMRPHEVRDGHVFLLSDNRTYGGEDSRTFGDVDPSTCVGRVFLRLSAAPAPSELGHAALDILE